MFKKLYPDMYVNSLLEIPLDEMGELGKRVFILDLDNTITEWNSNIITAEVAKWFAHIKDLGFYACILSNNGEKRVVNVAKQLDIPYVHRAQKPRRIGFNRVLKILNVGAEETVVIGDQVFTDILGGNRSGLYTILVAPINGKEFYGTKISRAMEYFVLKKIKKRVES